MLRTKQQENAQATAKLKHGLENLNTANKLVEEMQKQLSELQPQLAEKVIITDQLLARISQDQALLDGVKRVIVVEEAEVYLLYSFLHIISVLINFRYAQTEITVQLATDAQQDLDAALPALEAAIVSLNSLNKNGIHSNNPIKLYKL